jgi:urease accessory protein
MLLIHEKLARLLPSTDRLTLPFELRQKSRQRVTLDSGREAGLILAPGTVLRPGDLLAGDDDSVILVCAALELVTTARTGDPLRLARACYHLGNRHVPVQVGPGWVRFVHDHVLDQMLAQLGLRLTGERTVFEPEAGAYNQSGGHTHADVHQSSQALPQAAHGQRHAH